MERTSVGSIASGGSACQLVGKHSSKAHTTKDPCFSRHERKEGKQFGSGPQPFGWGLRSWKSAAVCIQKAV